MTSRVLCQMSAIAPLASFTVTAQGQLNNSAAIDDYLEQAVLTTKIPGVVALVINNENALYSAAFGQQNTTAEIPMSMGTLFNIASMTKPVAAIAIMMLVFPGPRPVSIAQSSGCTSPFTCTKSGDPRIADCHGYGAVIGAIVLAKAPVVKADNQEPASSSTP